MGQYDQSMDEYDLFHILNIPQPQESQIIFDHHQSSNNSNQESPFQNQLQAKKERPTNDPNYIEHLQNQNPAYFRTKPRFNCIDFSIDVKNKKDAIHQGSKDDTVELNINFKTIVFNHFKDLLLANELSEEQTKLLHQFGNRSPSFKSFITFCSLANEETTINSTCLAFIESSLIIRRILQSKSKMGTKLNMIKFVEVLRLNIRSDGRVIKWKEAIRK